jgi:hypothetical protein
MLAAQALELTHSKFKRMCMTYLKIDIENYYTENKTETINVYQKVQNFVARAVHEYGTSYLDFDSVTSEIAAM